MSSIGKRILLALLAVDATFVLLNVVVPRSVYLLDEEANLTTWYSSAKLLGLAGLALWIWTRERTGPASKDSAVWLLVAVFFTALSADETATLHERAAAWAMDSATGSNLRFRFLGGDATKDAFIWPILFAPFIAAILFFLVRFAWTRFRRCPRALWFALGGCALFATAVALEGAAVYSSPDMDAWTAADISRYQATAIVEEAAELFGTTLFLSALATFAALTRSGRTPTEARGEPSGA